MKINMRDLFRIPALIIALLLTPLTALSGTTGATVGLRSAPANLKELIERIFDLADQLIPLVVTLALIYFFWGLAQFILNAENEEERKKGKSVMIWGVIVFFVIFSIGGILLIIHRTFF